MGGCRRRLRLRAARGLAGDLEVTDNEDEVIVPARAGALRVVRAARDAGVKRVVLTSAFHAVGYGHPHTEHVFTEDDCRSP